MKPNRFSKLTKEALGYFGQFVLVAIAIATVGAVIKEIMHILSTGTITVAELLLMFLYLEVMSMLSHYLGSGNLPVRYPLYIGIIALARFMVLEVAELDAFRMWALSGSILLISLAILVVRFGHVKFPYTDHSD